MPCGKRTLMLYTGGTIGMVKQESGSYAPKAKIFMEKISNNPDLCESSDLTNGNFTVRIEGKVINYTIIEYDPLLDSSNMSTKEWIRIANDIKTYYDKYDAFIVLNGTDTLAYTASALSFMLEGLTKSVVITGSQISLFQNRNDAKDNILSALFFASILNVPEVCIAFNHMLFRGNRTEKYTSNMFDAFCSPNYHHIGRDGVKFSTFPEYIENFPRKEAFAVFTELSSNVSVVMVHPVMQLKDIEALLSPPTDGVVLQSYGDGNICSDRKDVMGALRMAVCRGVIIVNMTQCYQGSVSPAYETGKALFDIGIIPVYDITLPAAVTKLCYVLGKTNLTLAEKKDMMSANIRGELTETSHEL